MAGRLAQVTRRGRRDKAAPAETADPSDPAAPTEPPRERRDRAVWIPVALVLVAAAVILVLVLTGGSDDDPATTGATPSTPDDDFTIESDEGSLTFDQDDDEASVAFSGPDEEGRFSFDLDGDGVVAEGEGGSFELDGGAPPAWPTDFPVPAGADPVRGSVLDAGELVQLSTTYRTSEPPDDVVAYYLDALSDLDALVEDPPEGAEPGSAGATTISFEGRWTGFISVGQADEATILAVQLYSEPVPSN